MSAEEKQIRAVIAKCSDIPQLKAYCAEYKAAAEARFGPQGSNRVSEGEDPAAANVSAKDEDITVASQALFGKVGE